MIRDYLDKCNEVVLVDVRDCIFDGCVYFLEKMVCFFGEARKKVLLALLCFHRLNTYHGYDKYKRYEEKDNGCHK